MSSDAPFWNNTSEYPSVESPEYKADFAAVEKLIEEITQLSAALQPELQQLAGNAAASSSASPVLDQLRHIAKMRDQATELLANLATFANCEFNVDSKNTAAREMHAATQVLSARLEESLKPSQLFLWRTSDEFATAYLSHPETEAETFYLGRARRLKNTLLSDNEEVLLTALRVSGHTSWGNLYDTLSGQMKCQMKTANGTETVGLARAAALLRSSDESTRRAAWESIQEGWTTHEESCAAILNSLAGWRLEMARRRSSQEPVDYLFHPLHSNRIKRETLEAMFAAVAEMVEVPRQGLRQMASAMGKDKLDPWDLLAPAPHTSRTSTAPVATALSAATPAPTVSTAEATANETANDKTSEYTYAQGLGMVRDACAEIDPAFGDFIDMMNANQWIEAGPRPNKRQGAFCTRFAKSRTPRVFMTYLGSVPDTLTLAHELGHAFHGWALRDLPRVQTLYPMTLAETASVFNETVLSNHLLRTSTDEASRFAVSYQQAESAASFLINIPARFEFERNFYELRKKRTLTPDDFRELMTASWNKWYGNTLSKPDPMYWASKLHFHMAGTSFYNFPYTFGYLFSQSIYARRASLGTSFFKVYVDLLRDTGRMTAEDLVKKHLGENISEPEFWKKGLAVAIAAPSQPKPRELSADL